MSPLSFSIAPAKAGDTTEILALQHQNHVSSLPAQTLADGFVTTLLSPETLSRMSAEKGIWTARASDGTLAAYACANEWDFYGDGPFQRAVKALLPLHFDGRALNAHNSFQYGPVCVARPFRGEGVLELVIETIKTNYAPRFEFGLTFIDTRNERSLAAHERKQGFRRVALLPFERVSYHVLAFATR